METKAVEDHSGQGKESVQRPTGEGGARMVKIQEHEVTLGCGHRSLRAPPPTGSPWSRSILVRTRRLPFLSGEGRFIKLLYT